jgi:hypothetical protein
VTFDFKSEALKFAQANGCPPACIIQRAMERGAELAVENMIVLISGEMQNRKLLNATGIKDGEKAE